MLCACIGCDAIQGTGPSAPSYVADSPQGETDY
jgi:hypothetical protein